MTSSPVTPPMEADAASADATDERPPAHPPPPTDGTEQAGHPPDAVKPATLRTVDSGDRNQGNETHAAGEQPGERRAASSHRRDAVGQAEELRARVAVEMGVVLEGAPALGDVYVGWVAALDAAMCPARYRASGEDGWGFPGWSPVLATGAVARAALAQHLRVTASGPGGSASGPLPHPLEAVRDWLRDAGRAPTSPVAEWVRGLVRDGDRATIAATAASAGRWLAGFVRVVGWPLPDRLGVVVDDPEGPNTRRWHKHWRPPRTARPDVSPGDASQPRPARRDQPQVTVASSPDAVVGKLSPAGEFDLLVHRPTSPSDDALADRAAFEAVAGALASGIVPRSIVVTTADTGEHARCPIDSALLDRGLGLVVEVVRQRVVATEPGWTLDDGTPSAACRHCPVQSDCPPGQLWLTGPGPGRWRGGLPTLHPET